MNIQTLIDILRTLPVDGKVTNASSRVGSYRGYYEQLAIEPGNGTTVNDLMFALDDAVGSVVEGYKGGEYLIHPETTVWFSEYGVASSRLVTGITITGPGQYEIGSREDGNYW